MKSNKFLQKMEKFEIEKYQAPKDKKTLIKTHVSFSGSPQKHPYAKEKIILLADPYSKNTFYYEIDKQDISYVEELPNIVSVDGDIYNIVRIWVKKMSVAIRCMPFLVSDL